MASVGEQHVGSTSVTAPGSMTAGRRDGVTVVLGLWVMIGLFVDGYVHNTRGDQLESFFTPWHGLLYSGFVASALWLVWPALTTTGRLRERLDALPHGYALGLLGVVIFAIGGMGDAVWHTLLGIEVDLEALISPPHLVLFGGMMLILTTPFRAGWERLGATPTFREFLPTLASVTFSALLVGFFFMYASGLYDFHAMTVFQEFAATEFAATPFLVEVLNSYGILARLSTTAILMLPALLLLRRWTPPRGSFTFMFTTYGLFMLVLNNLDHPELLGSTVLAGIVADAAAQRLQRASSRRHGAYAFAVAVPASLWVTHFVVLAAMGNLAWPFLLWGGVVMFAAGTGLALALAMFPAPSPSGGVA